MTAILALAVVLTSFVVLAIAVGDTVRFVRRTGGPLSTAIAYRSYLA